MKTNFDIVANSSRALGIFLDKLISENNIKGNVCKYCTERDSIVCEAECSNGFKKWLEQDYKGEF